jgi:hypothetical protein
MEEAPEEVPNVYSFSRVDHGATGHKGLAAHAGEPSSISAVGIAEQTSRATQIKKPDRQPTVGSWCVSKLLVSFVAVQQACWIEAAVLCTAKANRNLLGLLMTQ